MKKIFYPFAEKKLQLRKFYPVISQVGFKEK